MPVYRLVVTNNKKTFIVKTNSDNVSCIENTLDEKVSSDTIENVLADVGLEYLVNVVSEFTGRHDKEFSIYKNHHDDKFHVVCDFRIVQSFLGIEEIVRYMSHIASVR